MLEYCDSDRLTSESTHLCQIVCQKELRVVIQEKALRTEAESDHRVTFESDRAEV